MLYFICKVFIHDSGFSETLHSQSLSSRIKVVCLLKFFIELYVFLDCLSRSLSYCFAGCFQLFMNITCSTLEVKLKQKWFWELLLLGVFEFLNKYFFLLLWSVYLFSRYCSFKHSTARTALGSFFGGKSQKWLAGRMILEIELPRSFLKFLLKAYYYPAYYTEVDWPDWTVLSNSWILHIKTFDVVFIFMSCCARAREVRASIALNWMSAIWSCKNILWNNCRIIGKIE